MSREEQKGIEAPEILLTPYQVAQRWGLKVDFVYHCERLRPYRRYVGRFLRFSMADIEAFERNPNPVRGKNLFSLMRQTALERTFVVKAKPKRKLLFDIE